ncbi:protein of unknown function [Candidatus Nitrosocosmicus franklandus]|uniref:Uncharacterized protein n=1 Tax=Candidatus Nitrosocosmicus franklandianus TaxID=1798806 RepID=A0A484IC42_9ARCH|nr:protein of unknown function [Candidatus Nitrosocosmicus franklandus]
MKSGREIVDSIESQITIFKGGLDLLDRTSFMIKIITKYV